MIELVTMSYSWYNIATEFNQNKVCWKNNDNNSKSNWKNSAFLGGIYDYGDINPFIQNQTARGSERQGKWPGCFSSLPWDCDVCPKAYCGNFQQCKHKTDHKMVSAVIAIPKHENQFARGLPMSRKGILLIWELQIWKALKNLLKRFLKEMHVRI